MFLVSFKNQFFRHENKWKCEEYSILFTLFLEEKNKWILLSSSLFSFHFTQVFVVQILQFFPFSFSIFSSVPIWILFVCFSLSFKRILPSYAIFIYFSNFQFIFVFLFKPQNTSRKSFFFLLEIFPKNNQTLISCWPLIFEL